MATAYLVLMPATLLLASVNSSHIDCLCVGDDTAIVVNHTVGLPVWAKNEINSYFACMFQTLSINQSINQSIFICHKQFDNANDTSSLTGQQGTRVHLQLPIIKQVTSYTRLFATLRL